MKKMISAIVLSAAMTLSAAGQETPLNDQAADAATHKPVTNEHNVSVAETNSTNASIPVTAPIMPIAAPAIQFEGC